MDETKKKRHELETLKNRHDALDAKISELARRALLSEEDDRELARLKWEKRDLKEKIVQGESQLGPSSGPS